MPDSTLEQKNQELFEAISKKDLLGVRTALAIGADPNARWRPEDQYYTPLHLAVMRNDRTLIKELVKVPATDVNAKESRGGTPLGIAVQLRHVDLVKLLLESCPQIRLDVKDDQGNTAMDYAKQIRNEKGIRMRVALETYEAKRADTTKAVNKL